MNTKEMMELKQFDLNFDRLHYTIQPSGIRLVNKGMASNSDIFVKFESVGSKVIVENTRNLRWLGWSVLFLVIAIAIFVIRWLGEDVERGAEILYFSISMFLLTIFLLTNKKRVFLAREDNTGAVEFINTKRYRPKVDQFIKVLLLARNTYLIDKYSKMDEYIPYDQQHANLTWLYNLGLMTE
ncbi:hypothetical protein [Mucilaginibacter myungsuensis]|uniref:Uncharacterized protein n=1 Tax=Mucilaginibacter myungsuensis TaxID=649104 RepID=A0A929L4H2_9SPHI|nr:hypothetical protein [Mucilaginibacter myungsuensis]MBE9664304.1 hypothetical protein [Mucilaginibacter myungsuensis]MDN3597013.1 hypothetical protein [Mucilaginibacter myungsuensis]